MINVLTKFKKSKVTIPMDLWEEKFQYIKSKWKGTPVDIHTYIFPSMKSLKAEFPKFTNHKNEIYIGVTPWPSNGTDIVIITKGSLCLEYPLDNHTFEEINDDYLQSMGLIPENQYCNQCDDFSATINVDGHCPDCK